MDYKKDIKDIHLARQTLSSGVAIFGSNTSKKCERLATAIYLVTNFLSDTEPMKARLRTLSLELVREASVLKGGSRGMETTVLDAIRENILETLSLFELAFVAGLVSEMNFTILKREYKSLSDTIEIKKASRESITDSILGSNFFDISDPAQSFSASSLRGSTLTKQSSVPAPIQNPTFKIQHSDQNLKGHSIGQTTTTMSDRNPKKQDVLLSLRGGTPTRQSSTPSSLPRATTDITKESRRTRILKLVKDNREVTIKDIATHFPDLSEKTIQRELVSLVESNVLKKFGERRWSRYALA